MIEIRKTNSERNILIKCDNGEIIFVEFADIPEVIDALVAKLREIEPNGIGHSERCKALQREL